MARNNFAIAEMINNKIIEALEKGTIPWKKPWKTIAPRNLATNHVYQGINLLLLSLTNHASPYFLTFKQLQYIGGSLKQGTKGYQVVYWKVIEYSRDNGDGKETLEIPMIRYYTVFNLEQCLNLPENKIPKEEINFNPIETCEYVIDKYADKPEIILSSSAYYLRSRDIIGMPDKKVFTSIEEYYSTLFHEIIHSTGHEKRLNRHQDLLSEDKEDKYCKEELIAELGNAYVCAHCHISPKTIDNQSSYISHWLCLLKNDKKLLISASSAAKKAVDYILGNISADN